MKRQIYLNQEDISNALNYLNTAVELKPDYAKAYETIGVIYQKKEDYSRAIFNYEQTIEYNRRNYKAMARLASVYNATKQYASAKKWAKECNKVKRSYPDGYYELGMAEKGLGNRIAAINAFEKAKKSSNWRKIAEYEIDQIKKELD